MCWWKLLQLICSIWKEMSFCFFLLKNRKVFFWFVKKSNYENFGNFSEFVGVYFSICTKFQLGIIGNFSEFIWFYFSICKKNHKIRILDTFRIFLKKEFSLFCVDFRENYFVIYLFIYSKSWNYFFFVKGFCLFYFCFLVSKYERIH